MDDFAKKLIVLVFLGAFFGALLLEAPLIYKKVQDGGVPALNFLNPPAGGQNLKTSNSKIYSGKSQNSASNSKKDNSYSSPIHVPALDPVRGRPAKGTATTASGQSASNGADPVVNFGFIN